MVKRRGRHLSWHPPLLTTTPHQREDVSALDRFNVHRCPTRRVFSGTWIELMTCLPWLDTLTTGLPQPYLTATHENYVTNLEFRYLSLCLFLLTSGYGHKLVAGVSRVRALVPLNYCGRESLVVKVSNRG
ncbi:hypothetical protein TNCV_2273101 [Trichonephila clavipes]|nr:hypothetical protein TNCV_2273101 [Trichonephila clavipes]